MVNQRSQLDATVLAPTAHDGRNDDDLAARIEQLELVMRATNEGLWDWDLTTNEVHYSSRWKAMLGYADDELPDRFEEWERRVHPDDLAATLRAIRTSLAGETPAYEAEYRLRHKDGGFRWICARGVVARDPDGRPVRLVGSQADITERKQSDTALRQSQQSYQDLVHAIDGIVWEADAATVQFSFVSDQAERLLGYPTSRWIEEPTFWMDHILPEDREWAVNFCATATAEKRDHEFEYRMIAADGRTVWLRDIVTLVIEDDHAVKLRGVMVDITQRKRHEQELLRRDAIFAAVTFAAERLLRTATTWEEAVPEVLERLGRAAAVSRVYVFENYVGDDGELWTSQRFEWVATGVQARIDDPFLKALPYRAAGLGRWMDVLSRGEMLYGHVRELPETMHVDPSAADFQSLVLVPIFVDGMWWGNIGFDECAYERDFSAPERDALKAAADTLGAAIGRNRADQASARLAAIVESSDDAIIGMSLDGIITSWNPGAERLYGYSSAEAIGHSIAMLLPPDALALMPDALADLAQGARYAHYETERIRKDGSRVAVSVAISPVRDATGTLIGTSSIYRDITARKRVEAAIRESEAQKAAIVALALDCIVMIDGEGRITEFNPAAEQTFGYRRDEVLGKELAETIIPPSERDRHRRGFARYLATGQGSLLNRRLEVTAVRADGSEFPVELAITPVSLDGAQAFVGFLRDITDRKRFEQGLLRRDAILQAVRFAAESFLASTTTWEESVPRVLERLGRAADVSRVYVFENSVDDDGVGWATQRFEWVAPGITTQLDDPQLEPLSHQAPSLAPWIKALSRGELLHGHVRELPGIERVPADAGGPLSLVLVPIFVDGAWWGVIGFDECADERDFSAMERDALKAAADTLGAAISRSRAEQELKSERDFSSTVLDTVGALVAVIDRQGRIVRFNRACEELTGYTADEVMGQTYWELFLLPEEMDEVRSMMGEVAAGHFPHAHDNVWVMRDGSQRLISWNNTAILDDHGEPTFLIKTGIDITERRRAEKELRESQRVLTTLLSNLPGMAYRCRNDSDWTMTFVSDGSLDLTGYLPTELRENRRIAYADLIHPDDQTWVWQAVQTAVAADEPFRLTYRITTAAGAEKWVLEQGRGVRDGDGAVVALEGFITDVTDRVIARQLLEQRVEERTRELTTLLDVSGTVASTLELEPLLELVLDQLRVVVEYTGAVLLTLDGDELVIERARSSNVDLPDDELRGIRFPAGNANPLWDAIRRRQPVIIDDIRGESDMARAYRAMVGTRLDSVARNIRSWLAVPLAHKDRLLGMLAFSYLEPSFYTRRHAELAMALASQAALAIENARLYEQAQGTAALEERQRLARELHDSVSQALFGIGLGARTARTLLDQDPAKVAPPLDYVLSLAEAGLAEMRALIFELRPESLAQEGLAAALEKQAASLRARHGITVEAMLGEEPDAPMPVKEALYRIAQEALHNTVKHARASRVELALSSNANEITLSVADNGVGFDVTGSFPGHLGLRSMRERVERLGGSITLDSTPQRGTRIQARIPTGHRG